MPSSKITRSKISTAIIIAMFAPCVGTVAAQENTPTEQAGQSDDAVTLDRINVTGSRIARQGFVTPSPVTAITPEEIRATGAVTIGEVLTKLPQITPTYTLGNSTRFIGTAGLGLLDLRGLGTTRTLVLVNGRRHVGASPGSTAVDVNTIPVEWIERVEVITGGTSAVYGADAVAGVVNFIMKKSFDGVELRGQHGVADEGGFGRSFASISGGSNFAEGRGTAAASFEFSHQDRFGRGNREIGRQWLVSKPNPNYDPSKPPSESNPQTVLDGPGGNHSISYGGTFTLGAFDFRNPATYGNRYIFNPDGTFRNNRYTGPVISNTSCIDCDFADLNAVADLEPEFDRFSLNTLLSYEINQNHRLFFEGKHSKTKSRFYGQPAFDQPIIIQRDNAYISPELRALMTSRGAQTLSVNRFNVDAGRRGEKVDRQTTRFVVGSEGQLSENWTYETSLNYGQSKIDRINFNNRINGRWQAGLDAVRDANGNIVCRTSINPNAINPHTRLPYTELARQGCVPFSIFGDGAVSQAAAAWFNVNSVNESKLTQKVFNASVMNSALFNLPAGEVGFAGGVEYRKEESQENTDPLAAQGVTFLNAIPSRGGQYSVREVFAETTLPLLADLPGAHRLSVDLAGRYSRYSTIGSAKTWNVGINWELIPSLRFRGTNAKAVRAPGIGELFNPQSQNFATINDPCNELRTNPARPDTAKDPALRRANCAALGVPAGWIDTYSANRPGVSGGNPDLKPESADTVSFGFVWRPGFVEGFGVSIDYWRVTVTDAIGAVTAQINATRCVDAPGGINNPFCASIQRAPAGGYVDPNGREFPGHSIYHWKALNENLAKSRRVGVDLEMDYRRNIFGGDTVFRLVGTRLLQSREWAFQDFPDEYREWLTSVTDPRWRANFDASYKRGPWAATWTMNYVHHNLRVEPASYQSNPGSQSPIKNGSFTYHNARIGYDFSNYGLNVYLGVNNLFDKDPPVNYFGTDAGTSMYDSVGRFFYLGASYKFN